MPTFFFLAAQAVSDKEKNLTYMASGAARHNPPKLPVCTQKMHADFQAICMGFNQ